MRWVSYSTIAGSVGGRGLLVLLLLLGFLQLGHGQQVRYPELRLAGTLLKPNGTPLARARARVQLGYYVSTDPVAITDATGRFCFTIASDTIAQDSLVLYAVRLPKIGCYYQGASLVVAVASRADYRLHLQQDTRRGFRWQRRRRVHSVHI